MNADNYNEELDAMLLLKEGWDSYKAPAILPKTIEEAKKTIEFLLDNDFMIVKVSPSVVGAVGITCMRHGQRYYIECCNNGHIGGMCGSEFFNQYLLFEMAQEKIKRLHTVINHLEHKIQDLNGYSEFGR